MCAMNQLKTHRSYHVKDLEVGGLDNSYFFQLSDVFTHENMPVSQHSKRRRPDKMAIFEKTKIQDVDGIDLLIGTNASE